VQQAAFWLESYNLLPDAGGWADQDENLLNDILTYFSLRDRTEWEIEHGENTDYEEVQTDTEVKRLGDL
jgi:hypothetical protein